MRGADGHPRLTKTRGFQQGQFYILSRTLTSCIIHWALGLEHKAVAAAAAAHALHDASPNNDDERVRFAALGKFGCKVNGGEDSYMGCLVHGASSVISTAPSSEDAGVVPPREGHEQHRACTRPVFINMKGVTNMLKGKAG